MFNWSQKTASIVFGVSALVMGGAVSTPAAAGAEVDDFRQCGKGQSGCTGARAVKIEHETESGHSIYQNIQWADQTSYGTTSKTFARDLDIDKGDGPYQVSQDRLSYKSESEDGSSASFKSDRVWVKGELVVRKP